MICCVFKSILHHVARTKASDLEWEMIDLCDFLCVFKSILHHVARIQSFRFRVGNNLSDFCAFKSIRIRVGNDRYLWFFVCSKVFYITLREFYLQISCGKLPTLVSFCVFKSILHHVANSIFRFRVRYWIPTSRCARWKRSINILRQFWSAKSMKNHQFRAFSLVCVNKEPNKSPKW